MSGRVSQGSPWKMLILIGAFIFLLSLFKGLTAPAEISPTQFKEYISAKKVDNLEYSGEKITGELRDPQAKSGNQSSARSRKVYTLPATLEEAEEIRKLAEKSKVTYKRMPDRSWIASIIGNLFWLALFFGAWWFIVIRPMAKGGKAAFSFGQSKAKRHQKKAGDVTFKDVAGCEEAKEELQEVVEFLKNPAKFRKLGGKVPKGVLLVGPPGNGKTLLAKAVAGEANVAFFKGSGSEFVEMFVGVGASRVRDLFNQARQAGRAVIFIDELDSVGRKRFSGIGSGHDEREQTLNQLLVELDGFDASDEIILIGATNMPEVLDPALTRPGRFDRKVPIPLPTLKDREEILQVHAANVKLDPGANLKVIAQRTPTFTGADLANVINEAALLAARHDKETVQQSELEEAIERVIAGPKRKRPILVGEEKKIVAYHESGHTLVAKLLSSDPVHKVTLLSHGEALGYTLQLPDDDKKLTSKEAALNRIKILLGGRTGELLFFSGDDNKVTNGASDDLRKASQLAWHMVAKWGMGKNLIVVPENQGLRNQMMYENASSNPSSKMLDDVNAEVGDIISKARSEVLTLLKEHKRTLEKLAEALFEKGELNSEEIDLICNGSA